MKIVRSDIDIHAPEQSLADDLNAHPFPRVVVCESKAILDDLMFELLEENMLRGWKACAEREFQTANNALVEAYNILRNACQKASPVEFRVLLHLSKVIDALEALIKADCLYLSARSSRDLGKNDRAEELSKTASALSSRDPIVVFVGQLYFVRAIMNRIANHAAIQQRQIAQVLNRSSATLF